MRESYDAKKTRIGRERNARNKINITAVEIYKENEQTREQKQIMAIESSGNIINDTEMTCFNCYEKGHFARNCPFQNKEKSTAMARNYRKSYKTRSQSRDRYSRSRSRGRNNYRNYNNYEERNIYDRSRSRNKSYRPYSRSRSRNKYDNYSRSRSRGRYDNYRRRQSPAQRQWIRSASRDRYGRLQPSTNNISRDRYEDQRDDDYEIDQLCNNFERNGINDNDLENKYYIEQIEQRRSNDRHVRTTDDDNHTEIYGHDDDYYDNDYDNYSYKDYSDVYDEY
jgi:arginine/serine-rich splicing factor 2